MKNPYLNRVAIRDTGQFYGRRKELARIFSRIGASRPQSVSIVGERRIGKSSLLNFIYSPETRAQQLDGGAGYIFLFMDLQQKRYSSIESFFADLLGLLAERLGESMQSGNTDFDAVRRVFADLHRRGYKLIVLFDEFDAITTNRVFNLDFFAFLRSAANNYDVAYITSSARDLQVLCHTDQIADSPFFNIFTNVYLRPFTPDEAATLIREPSRAAGVPLEPYNRQIVELAGYFPFFLQIACSNYIDHIAENGALVDERRIDEGFLDEARVHFRYIWQHFHEEERVVVDGFISGLGLQKAHEHVFEELRRAGYFIEDGQTTRLFSRLFAPAIARLVSTFSRPSTEYSGSVENADPTEIPIEELVPPTDPAINATSIETRRIRRERQSSLHDSIEQVKQYDQIGRFEIIRTLGQGGMGEVFLARDTELTRQVAIKLLKSRYASDEQIRRRFLREAQTASILSHPNIATIYEIGEIDDIPYIVMEYVRGTTLSERLHKQPFTIDEIVNIGTQTALALAEAHSAGIIHRDVKSSNIILNDRGRVKVLDFGLAKPGIFEQRVEENTPQGLRVSNITEPGILLGTVTYMSPEQASGKEVVDHRSDIFSLGIVLYEITTGVLPFDGSTYFQVIEAAAKQDPTPIERLRQDVPPELMAVIMRALAKRPEDRFQSAQSMAAELQKLRQ
jgi:eukaryotic-like serine/threonine-protein kinase